MKLRFRYLAAAGAVAALVGAPTAFADDPGAGCDATGAGTECTSPGNVQIDDAPAAVGDPFGDGTYPGPYTVPFDEGSR
jgi:hypothetical protein